MLGMFCIICFLMRPSLLLLFRSNPLSAIFLHVAELVTVITLHIFLLSKIRRLRRTFLLKGLRGLIFGSKSIF